MGLTISIEEPRPGTRTVALNGRLDNQSAAELDRRLEELWPGPFDVLVFDLKHLSYISSLGIRSLFHAQKQMRQRQGESLFVDPQPAVRKVFDMVMAVDLASVFASTEELDAYLDSMQRKVLGQADGAGDSGAA
jgi:anti-anti-sigma factor